MELSEEEARDFVSRLEDTAEAVEDQIETFCEGVSPTLIAIRFRSNNYRWSLPRGETRVAQRNALENYEKWYNSSKPLIQEYLPEQLDRFEDNYAVFKEHILLNVSGSLGRPGLYDRLINAFDEQRNVVKSVPAKIEAEKFRARRQLSARMVRNEIQQARELFNGDFVRAAGVVAAVALERHLLMMCENSEAVTDYEPNHGINRLSQTLYEVDVIDKTTWRDFEALASIRETCAHPEEPKREAVQRLIHDAEEFIRKHNT